MQSREFTVRNNSVKKYIWCIQNPNGFGVVPSLSGGNSVQVEKDVIRDALSPLQLHLWKPVVCYSCQGLGLADIGTTYGGIDATALFIAAVSQNPA